MKILVLDGFALNPGDLSWQGIRELGTLVVYDRTEPIRLLNRIGDAQVILVNKCPISRETIEACPNLKLICVTATGYNTIDLEAAKVGESCSKTEKDLSFIVCRRPIKRSPSINRNPQPLFGIHFSNFFEIFSKTVFQNALLDSY